MPSLLQLGLFLADFHTLPAPIPLQFPCPIFTLLGKTKSGTPVQQLCTNKWFGTINQISWCWGHLCIYVQGFHFSWRLDVCAPSVHKLPPPYKYLRATWRTSGGCQLLVVKLCSLFQPLMPGWRWFGIVKFWTTKEDFGHIAPFLTKYCLMGSKCVGENRSQLVILWLGVPWLLLS